VIEPRHPRNAPGPFFCSDRLCVSCGAPLQVAPALITVDDDGEGRCYFLRQPRTPGEVEQACRAVEAACTGGVGYDGDDPAILDRLREELAARRRLAKMLGRLRGRWGRAWRSLRRAARPRR
jgi:hypothetical protein